MIESKGEWWKAVYLSELLSLRSTEVLRKYSRYNYMYYNQSMAPNNDQTIMKLLIIYE